MARTIFFSVGEPSGDQHAARLIQAIRQQTPDIQCRGFGGPEMAEAGLRLDADLTELAVMGLVEVAPKLRRFLGLARRASELFERGAIDRVVLVDFPGFNWHIARRAKRAGIPVDYYLPPQLWAWAPWRISKVRRWVDRVLCVLPFEYDWYRQAGIEAEFVGHPFFDAVAQTQLDQRLISRLSEMKHRGRQLVAVLPGSREHEVHRNGPLLLEAVRRLSQRHPDATFLVAAYRDSHCLWLRQKLTEMGEELPVHFFVGRTSEIIEAADCGMMVSGSVSLEMMARGTPGVVIYRVGRVFAAIARRVLTVDSFTLPNLMAGESIMPEFPSVGDPSSAVRGLVTETDRLLSDPEHLRAKQDELAVLSERFARPGASAAAAKHIVTGLEGRPPLKRAA